MSVYRGALSDRLSFEKIFYHGKHVEQVLNKGEAYPLHVELGLVNFCNHDCTFCYARRSMSEAKKIHKARMDRKRLDEVIKEMAGLGLKSVTLVGSGEPTIHPETAEIIRDIHSHGVDIALFTNGSGLRKSVNQAILDCCTFIRFSLTGASRKVHDLVHANNDYERIVENLRELSTMRGQKKFPTIGVQFVLASYSAEDVVKGAIQARDIGVDYYEIKPVYPSIDAADTEGIEFDDVQLPNDLSIKEAHKLMDEAKKLETENFKVEAKYSQLTKVYKYVDDRNYHDCPGSLTTTTLEADFNLYICDNQKIPKFCFGNLTNNTFQEVWNSERRKEVLRELNVHECPPRCRMDPLNVIYQDVRDGAREVPEDVGDPDPEIHPNFF